MKKILLAAVVSAFAFTQPALADDAYPSRPIKLVVPFAPGGATDIVARLLARYLPDELGGQSVIVENKPGAGGNIGGAYAAHAKPDGYTLVVAAAGPTVINPSLYSNMPYDPAKDLTPITLIERDYNLMVVNPKVPAKTLTEFIAYAKSKPGAVNFGSPGSGSPAHLAGELLNQMAGLKMTHIPYKGSGPAVNDLIAGRITMMIDNMPALLPYVKAGSLRAIAVASEDRAAAAPDIPTFEQAGLKGYVITAWKGLMAPTGTPPAIINKLHDAVVKVLKKPEMQKKLVDLGADPVGNTPEQFAAQIQSQTAWWAKLVKSTGTKID
jgi:tripartite-type tricarboxylate transporter receptor subunit TctC